LGAARDSEKKNAAFTECRLSPNFSQFSNLQFIRRTFAALKKIN
jgi:hypothetical protein